MNEMDNRYVKHQHLIRLSQYCMLLLTMYLSQALGNDFCDSVNSILTDAGTGFQSSRGTIINDKGIFNIFNSAQSLPGSDECIISVLKDNQDLRGMACHWYYATVKQQEDGFNKLDSLINSCFTANKYLHNRVVNPGDNEDANTIEYLVGTPHVSVNIIAARANGAHHHSRVTIAFVPVTEE